MSDVARHTDVQASPTAQEWDRWVELLVQPQPQATDAFFLKDFLVPILGPLFSIGESWERESDKNSGLSSSSLSKATETLPQPSPPEEVSQSRPAHCPRPSQASQPHCPFLFTLGGELLQSLSAVLAPFVCFEVKLRLCSRIYCKFHGSPSAQDLSTNPLGLLSPPGDKCQLTQERTGVYRYGGGMHKNQSCPQAGSTGREQTKQPACHPLTPLFTDLNRKEEPGPQKPQF